MIPVIRSCNELMVIAESKDQVTKESDEKDFEKINVEKMQIEDSKESKDEGDINLPNLPKTKRRKWIKNKKAISRFFDELDYNNQVQSTYDLTLLGRQENNYIDKVA